MRDSQRSTEKKTISVKRASCSRSCKMSHPLIQEFSISNVPNQVWQCGGSVEVLPCARIAHIERAHKPYTEDLTSHMRRNALRVAEVWMDEFKSHVYMAWNIPMEVSPRKHSPCILCLFIRSLFLSCFFSFFLLSQNSC